MIIHNQYGVAVSTFGAIYNIIDDGAINQTILRDAHLHSNGHRNDAIPIMSRPVTTKITPINSKHTQAHTHTKKTRRTKRERYTTTNPTITTNSRVPRNLFDYLYYIGHILHDFTGDFGTRDHLMRAAVQQQRREENILCHTHTHTQNTGVGNVAKHTYVRSGRHNGRCPCMLIINAYCHSSMYSVFFCLQHIMVSWFQQRTFAPTTSLNTKRKKKYVRLTRPLTYCIHSIDSISINSKTLRWVRANIRTNTNNRIFFAGTRTWTLTRF